MPIPGINENMPMRLYPEQLREQFHQGFRTQCGLYTSAMAPNKLGALGADYAVALCVSRTRMI